MAEARVLPPLCSSSSPKDSTAAAFYCCFVYIYLSKKCVRPSWKTIPPRFAMSRSRFIDLGFISRVVRHNRGIKLSADVFFHLIELIDYVSWQKYPLTRIFVENRFPFKFQDENLFLFLFFFNNCSTEEKKNLILYLINNSWLT